MDEQIGTIDDTTPNTTPTIFDLSVNDSNLLTLIRKPLQDSDTYWNKTKKLDDVRAENMSLWLPEHWKNRDVYDFQEDYLYQDPKVFTSVETIASVVNSRIPQPNVMPGQDNMISRQLSQDLQKVLFAHSEKYRISDIFRIAVRNLLIKRIGYVKLRFDQSLGEYGDIVPEFVLPEDIVVDQDARWGDVPRFIAQRVRNKTGEELCAMFPDAKQQIYAMLGVNRVNKSGDLVAYKTQLGQKRNIWEVWFRYYDQKEQKYAGGLAYTDENLQRVLGKMRNPNWNYEDYQKKGECANLLDFAEPPFMPINYLNDGSSYIDLTTMVEQAASLQRILDRRGFQIMDNADQSGSGLVFNTMMITKEEMAKLIGSPDERIGVKGDVSKAVTRVPPPPLPAYTIEDRNDAREEIDNIFATHDITRGAQSGSKTLGQDQMQQGQDYTRMDDIARAVERMAAKYYRYLAQMMKVYYTEDHWFRATGEDGQFDFVMMRSDMIEDGVDVNVEAGSTLPPNKDAQLKFASDLVAPGMIDPLSLYEVGQGGTLPSPKKMLERLIKWKTDPGSFMTDVQSEDIDRNAFMDIQILLRGDMPEPRDEISPEYLKFLNTYMTSSGDFMKQPDLIKHLFIEWAKICQETAQKQMQAMMSQLPSEEDMAATNQKALAQSQLEQQMGGGAPPQPGGQPGQPSQPGQPPEAAPPQGQPPVAPPQGSPTAPAAPAVNPNIQALAHNIVMSRSQGRPA